jgi:putative ABC transport system permease protein
VRVAPSDDGAVPAVVVFATTILMALVGLVAAAGFTVVARRRQRQLGLLGALGASERQLRLVVVSNGFLVGLIAAAAGTMLGIAFWLLASPVIEPAIGHRLDRFALPWSLIIGSSIISIIATTVAAWWPARSVARISTMSALSQRPPRPAPVRRSLLAAAVLFAGGAVALAFGQNPAGDSRPASIIGGTLSLVLGAVLVAPATIQGLRHPAGRLSLAGRLALRDLARNQGRAAAGLAAVTIAIGISAGIIFTTTINQPQSDHGNLAANQVLVRLDEDSHAVPGASVSPPDLARLEESVRQMAVADGRAAVVPLDVAIHPRPGAQIEPISAAYKVDAHSFTGGDNTFVASPEVLRSLGVDRTIASETELLTRSATAAYLIDPGDAQSTEVPAKHERVDLPSYTSAPGALITESAMKAHGWTAARTAWLLTSDGAPTNAQLDHLRREAAAAGLVVEIRTAGDGFAAVRTGAVVIGGVLALAIVAMSIGLLRAESGNDLAILTAAGATPRLRRSLTASAASALTVLGCALGTLMALTAVMAMYHDRLNRLQPMPWTALVVLLVGLPLVSAAGGWLLAGRDPQRLDRVLLE